MFKAVQCDVNEHIFHRITDLEEAIRLKDDENIVLWLDLQGPSEEDLARLGKEFHLHPLALEDATHEHQRPKVEEYEQFYFVVFYAIGFDNKSSHGYHMRELDMFLGERYLITVHETFIPELEEAEQRWMHSAKQTQAGVGILLYALLDTIVDRYFPVVDAMVDQAEELEDRVFSGDIRQGMFAQELLTLKRRFLEMRRVVTPERDVLNVLTNRDTPILEERATVYFRDVYDHIMRLAETVDLYRDQLSSIMDANLSIVSNDLNKVMRTLTSASIILMADALLAGIWGMNFDNMPELHLRYGYVGALILMLVLSAVLIFIFKLLRWL